MKPQAWLAAMLFCSLTTAILPAQAQSDAAVNGNQAEETPQTLRERYPAGSIQSTETSRQALLEVKQMRTRIEARFKEDQQACYPKFFTNICLNKVKDKQRQDLADLRPIEIEANAFNRKQRVVERDRRLAEKAAKDEQERKDRQIPVLPNAGSDKRAAEQDVSESARQVRAEKAAQKRAAFDAAQRKREQEAPAEAAKREENAQKYEAKVEDYEQRQREVAKKQAEKVKANANQEKAKVP